MNVPIKVKSEVAIPPAGYVFVFIDSEDMQLKAKLSDGMVINYTNVNDDLKTISLADYTAFEVFAHDYDIPVGECKELGGYVNNSISASMTHAFKLRSTTMNDKDSDVVIDWGDGKLTYVTDGIYDKKEVLEEDREVTYYFSHTYQTTSKYIVKIYGTRYFSIRSISTSSSSEIADGDPAILQNLVCRVLDVDLPLASNVTNLANLCNTSLRLLNVHVPSYFSLNRIENVSGIFRHCINLINATGFKRQFCNANVVEQFFTNCSSLVTTDFTLPPTIARGAASSIFNKCSNLKLKVSDIFTDGNALSGKININRIFFNCGDGLDVTDCYGKLWGNPNVEWSNTSYAFKKCPASVLSQVPVSWGGTNKNIDNQLKLQSYDKCDYTAFEVYAHEETIPVGESEVLGGYVNYEIPGSMVHSFNVRAYTMNYKDSDVIIDWGDGAFEAIADKSFVSEDIDNKDKETQYTVSHTYGTAGKYVIKVYGKRYYSITHGVANQNNLLCRILTADLPVASHLNNFASFARAAQRLIYVDAYECVNFGLNYANVAKMFYTCKNLISARGFSIRNKRNMSCDSMFASCLSLEFTDFQVAHIRDNLSSLFSTCPKLAVNVSDIFKYFYVDSGKSVNVFNLFVDNSRLTGTVPADKLWERRDITWLEPKAAFKNCPEEIRVQVPVSWGGTNAEIDKELESTITTIEKYNELEQRVKALEEALSNTLALDK